MRLMGWELRKLCRLPALWAVLVLCLLFNGALILGDAYGRPFFNFTSGAAADMGQRVDGNFLSELRRQPRSWERDTLLDAATGLENIYERYDTAALSEFYQNQVKESSLAVKWMARKYEQAADRVSHLADTGAALDLYAGPITHDSHQFLFGTLMRAVLGEACVLGMLSMLYLLGYENMTRTASLLYATRIGRGLQGKKIIAGAGAGLALYALLLLPSLGLYLTLWDYGGIWNASVSSQFNYIRDLLIIKPFLTWADFTVAGYLAASAALGAALILVCVLLAAACGTLVDNTYLAALTLVLLFAGGLAAASGLASLGLWPLYFAACFQPVILWLSQNVWFTELGLNAVLPWQETWAAALNFLLLSGISFLALRHFKRKDLMG